MARTAILAIRIISDARKAAKDLQGIGDTSGKMERGLAKVTPAAKKVALGIAAIGAASFKQASDLQQSSGAVESVFGRQANAVKKLGQNAAGSVGLAQSEYQQLASVLGSQLGNLGVSQGKLVGTTDSLIKKGADLSAMFGGTSKEAVEALSAAMRGETDPIERYGISIKQANVNALLAKRGQDKLTGAALTAAKTQATLDLITQQSAKSQGQFARESDTASGAQQRAMASAKNAGAALGQVLLPVVASLATKAAELAGYIQRNSGLFITLGAILGGLAAAVFAVNAALSAYKAIATAVRVAIIVWRNAQLALNLAMMANPVGLVIAAIVILVGLFVLAYKKSDTFRAIVQAAMRAAAAAVKWVVAAIGSLIGWVKDKAPAAFNAMKTVVLAVWRFITAPARAYIAIIKSVIAWVKEKAPAAFNAFKDGAVKAFNAVISPVKKLIGWVQDLLDKIRSVKIPSVGGIGGSIFGGGGIFGFSSAAPAPAPTLFGARGLMGATPLVGGLGGGGSLSRSSANAGATIIVQGALDPDAVARQIETILGRRARRIGRP
jgi:hypothetical protein